MAKFKHINPETGEPEVVEIDVPPGMKKDQRFLEQALDQHYASIPSVEKSRRDNMQGLKGPMDLSKPVTYGSNQPDTPPPATGIRKVLLGDPNRNVGHIPIVSDTVDTIKRGINAPISGESWDNKTADIVEGAGTLIGTGLLPEIAGNPLRSIMSLVPGYGASKAVQAVTNNRLASDAAGLAAGGAEFKSPKIRAGTIGALQGGLESIFDTSAKYHGIPVPPVIAGGALGKIAGSAIPGGGEAGAIVGATLPVAKGMYEGAKTAARDYPLFESKPVSRPVPARGPIEPYNPPEVQPINRPLPSGRIPGTGKPRIWSSAQYMHPPGWIYLPTSEPYNPPEVQPISRPLPSGRIPGTGESRTVTPPEPVKYQTPNPVKRVPRPIKGEPNVPSEKTQETEYAGQQTTQPKAKGPKETETASSQAQTINPVMDKVLSHADPTWDGKSQVTYPHIVKVADAVGIKPNQVRSMLTELGYPVSPSKFQERINKGTYKDIPWDKLTEALKGLSKD